MTSSIKCIVRCTDESELQSRMNPNDSIYALKQWIQANHPQHPAAADQKLITAGRLLADTIILADLLRQYPSVSGEAILRFHLVVSVNRPGAAPFQQQEPVTTTTPTATTTSTVIHHQATVLSSVPAATIAASSFIQPGSVVWINQIPYLAIPAHLSPAGATISATSTAVNYNNNNNNNNNNNFPAFGGAAGVPNIFMLNAMPHLLPNVQQQQQQPPLPQAGQPAPQFRAVQFRIRISLSTILNILRYLLVGVMCAIGAVAFLFENGYLTVNALRPPQALVDRMRAVRQLNPWLRRAYDVFVPFIQSLFLIDPLAGNANNNANENNAAVEDEQQENNNVDNGVNNNDDDNNNNNNNPPDDEGLRRRNNNGHQNNAEFLMGQ